MTLAYRPLIEVPPPCNAPTAAGWCVLPERHTGSHVPIPATYPPKPAALETPTGGGPVPAVPGGPAIQLSTTQTPAAVQVGEALPAVGHHPEWDGNRCSNCNARLSDAGPHCPMTEEPDWLTAEMNRQRRAGIPNLDNVSDGSRPDVDHEDQPDDGGDR